MPNLKSGLTFETCGAIIKKTVHVNTICHSICSRERLAPAFGKKASDMGSDSTDNQKNVTSQMIADLANVSRATVYRVMNNNPYVNEDVRTRVKKVIDEHSYKPNYAGTALVRQKKRVKIGVVGLNANNPLYNEIRKGSEQAAEEYRSMGIEVLFRETKDITYSDQVVEAILELMEEEIKGLALLGVDDINVRETVQSIQSKIPVVTFNTNISDVEEFCFVGQDPIKSGRTAGGLMCELLNQGNVIVIANSLKVLAVADRIMGFKEKVSESKQDIRITGVYENDSSEVKNYELVRGLCEKNERIDGIYIASGFGSGGTCRAIEECGLHGVRIIAHDLLPDTKKHLKDGKIAFTIGQELKRQGYLPIEILVKYLLMSERPKDKKIYTKISILNAENL